MSLPSSLSTTLMCLALLASTAHAARRSSQEDSYKQIRYIMGTTCEITVYADSSDTADEAFDAAFDELKRIDSLLSNWNPESELMRMNASAARVTAEGVRPQISVSSELGARLKAALQIAKDTGGGFDPTVGPLVRAWGFLPVATGSDRSQAIADARADVGWEKVMLSPDTSSIQFSVPDMEIDLGGIGKGYAAERAVEIVREHGIRRALVSLGTSSIAALGIPPGASGWPILIRDPRDGKTPAAWLELRDGESLATSGTYENTTGAGRARRSHIINPQTGQAIGGLKSVTVLMDNAETADALTKPFFLISINSARDWPKWLARFPKASIILMDGQGGELKQIAGGESPDRFKMLSARSKRKHVAETNRRSAHDIARDDARGPGNSPQSP